VIAISIDRDPESGGVIVAVADDGSGLRAEPEMGYGLIGMEERVRVLGGRLTFSNRPEGGFAVTAALPLTAPQSLAAAPPAETAI
jgi:signal transduction histidine kinase